MRIKTSRTSELISTIKVRKENSASTAKENFILRLNAESYILSKLLNEQKKSEIKNKSRRSQEIVHSMSE